MEPIHVLMVDDSEADRALSRACLEASRLKIGLSEARDGADALEQLQALEASGGALPDLILLDLNMPRMNGTEFLAAVNNVPRLRRIPVVVLTSSSAERDVVDSYDLGAACYVTKPVDLDQFQKIVDALEGFWFTVVRFPPQTAG